MSPRFAQNNAGNCALVNAEGGCKTALSRFASGVNCSYFQNFFIGQFCVSLILASRYYFRLQKPRVILAASELLRVGFRNAFRGLSALFFHHVAHINGVRSKKYVVGIDAQSVVALVANIQSFRYLPKVNHPRHAVGLLHFSVDVKRPVSLCLKNPIPATSNVAIVCGNSAVFIDPAPKAKKLLRSKLKYVF